MMHLDAVISQTAVAVLTTILGWVVGRLTVSAKADKQERDALYDGVRLLLRSELMATHHQVMHDGYITTTDREVLQRTYDAYHKLKGNGVASKLYQEAMALPTHDYNECSSNAK